MVISVVIKRHFWVVISAVKKRQFRLVVSVVEITGSFGWFLVWLKGGSFGWL